MLDANREMLTWEWAVGSGVATLVEAMGRSARRDRVAGSPTRDAVHMSHGERW